MFVFPESLYDQDYLLANEYKCSSRGDYCSGASPGQADTRHPRAHGLSLTLPGPPPPGFWSPVLRNGLNNPWQEPHEVPVTGSDVTLNIEVGPASNETPQPISGQSCYGPANEGPQLAGPWPRSMSRAPWLGLRSSTRPPSSATKFS